MPPQNNVSDPAVPLDLNISVLRLPLELVVLLCCPQFSQSVECKGHTGPVCAVDAVCLQGSEILVASSASDSTVRLWLSNGAQGNRNNMGC